MNELLAGLMYGKPVAFWVAGIAIAFAWLNRGASPLRLGVLAAAVLWPAAPASIALAEQRAAQRAAERFTVLCATEAYERIHRRSGSVTEIFLEGSFNFPEDILLRHHRDAITQRLQLGLPQAVLISGTARYGVKLEYRGESVDRFVREFRVQVLDKQAGELLAEQRSYIYRTGDTGPLAYPLWRSQLRTCPLAHPSDFVRSALGPTRS
jgi:hypothetical protein